MARPGCEIMDIDSAVPLAEARARVGREAVLLGGLDPVRVLLHGAPEDVRSAAMQCRRAAGERYILGARCEVPAGTPAANLDVLADCARQAATSRFPADPASSG